MKWTPEEHAHMVELLREGRSTARTARALTVKFGREFTRNSVISRANRKNVPIGNLVVKPRPRRKPKAKAKLALPGHVSAMPPVMLPVEPLPEDDPNDIPLRILDDLEDDHCRWPIDGPIKGRTFGFCCREKVKGLPYCEKHSQRAYPGRAPKSNVVSEQREKEPA